MHTGLAGAPGHDPFPVDPHALIDQVMLNPRLLCAEADTEKREIRKYTGFKGKILHSLLNAQGHGFFR